MIPEELKKYANWVCWKYVKIGERKTKIPITPMTGKRAMSNNPSTWGTYEEALEMSRYYSGLGFVFSKDDPFIGIDIDHCIDVNGTIEEYAASLLEKCGSYAELSPSGTGIHIIGKASMLEGMGGRRTTLIEMYDKNRFFTITGKQLGEYNEVADIQPMVNAICEKYFTKPTTRKEVGKEERERLISFNAASFTTDDMSFLKDVLYAQKNGDVIRRMYEGENPLFGGDASRNDLYFCNQCNWANGNDIEQTDRIFRSSGRMREKWDVKHWANGHTYGQETLLKALSANPKSQRVRYQKD